MAAIVQCLVIGVLCTAANSFPASAGLVEVGLSVDSAEVLMGRSVILNVQVNYPDGGPAASCLVLPYVDHHRWGRHEITDERGQARIILPLPNPGTARIEVRAIPRVFDTYWIWTPDATIKRAWLVKRFSVDEPVIEAELRVSVDKEFSVYLNGGAIEKVGDRSEHETVFSDLAGLVRQGENLLAIEATSERKLAGIAAQLRLKTGSGECFIVSDRSWECWAQAPAGWPEAPAGTGLTVRAVGRLRDAVICPGEASDTKSWPGTFYYPGGACDINNWPGTFCRDDLFVGRLLPEGAIVSKHAEVRVSPRRIESKRDNEHLIGIELGGYFSPAFFYWRSAQAVPLIGFYESCNPDVIRQHALWLMDMGVDFILTDWPYHIAPDKDGRQHWRNRPDRANAQIHATAMTLEVYAGLRDNGYPVPRLVIMPFLSNGPANSTETINEQLQWLYDYFIRNPRFTDLWLRHDGKPLIAMLYTAAKPVEQLKGPPIDDSHFTVRFVSTQLQLYKMYEQGYWSWMDGSAEPIVTYRDGKAEAVTPTPAYFSFYFTEAPRSGWAGWLSPQAVGRRNGTTYVRSFKPAIEHRPQHVLLNQWNEFTGQLEGYPCAAGDVYGDSYSVELSNDLEPASLTSSGYRGDDGGWGFFYYNLAQALVDLYKQITRTTTVMAVYPPDYGAVVTGGDLEVRWEVIGKEPDSYVVLLDSEIRVKGLRKKSYVLDLTNVTEGEHVLTVVAEGAVTRYLLSRERQDEQLAEPVPLKVATAFVVKR